MSFRSFSEEMETRAQKWSQRAETADVWRVAGSAKDIYNVPDSESKPLAVYCGSIRGVAKPGVKNRGGIPRAAHEKIAADLAYYLKLPVSPVILWDRGNVNADEEQYVSISAWAFWPVWTWATGTQYINEAERQLVAPAFSAMRAFETWISADDRDDKHALVGLPQANGKPEICFIDYAYGLSKVWSPDKQDTARIFGFMPGDIQKDAHAMEQTIVNIEKFDAGLIDEIVERIPDGYLSTDRKQLIIHNLRERRETLRATLNKA